MSLAEIMFVFIMTLKKFLFKNMFGSSFKMLHIKQLQ